mmetsp:Transcript_34070/g.101217  ORF Transcript_34070/g.101217 Transcript_34070/m.101217 type:complete len:284 (-) Transcript_34070:1345-2196(-)
MSSRFTSAPRCGRSLSAPAQTCRTGATRTVPCSGMASCTSMAATTAFAMMTCSNSSSRLESGAASRSTGIRPPCRRAATSTPLCCGRTRWSSSADPTERGGITTSSSSTWPRRSRPARSRPTWRRCWSRRSWTRPPSSPAMSSSPPTAASHRRRVSSATRTCSWRAALASTRSSRRSQRHRWTPCHPRGLRLPPWSPSPSWRRTVTCPRRRLRRWVQRRRRVLRSGQCKRWMLTAKGQRRIPAKSPRPVSRRRCWIPSSSLWARAPQAAPAPPQARPPARWVA